MTIEVSLGKVPATGRGQRSAMAATGAICALAAISALATNIFLPSLPAIAADLKVSSAAVTSAIAIFPAILAIGQLIVGPLSDRFGRQMPVLIGLCIFVLGTIWCAFAHDLVGLLIARSVQAAGACTAAVLSRAIARDLFDGQALAKTMAAITMATAAAPGFSPLFGSALDHLFGWRSEFIFVAAFAIGAAAAYAAFVGETKGSTDGPLHPREIVRAYFGLLRDPRFVAPARIASLLTAGLYAVFAGAPRALLEGFGLAAGALGLSFAAVVLLVFGAGMLAPKLSARLGSYYGALVGLGLTFIGGAALLVVMLVARDAFPLFLLAVSIFLFGVGIATPLSSAAALSPFGNKAGAAAALFGFSQMAGGACGASLVAVLSSDPAIALGLVLALTSVLSLLLHMWKGAPQ